MMRVFHVITFIFCLTWILSPRLTQANSSCCQHHHGLCGDQCCDGTPLTDHCGQIKIIRLPPPATPQTQEETRKQADTPLSPPPQRLYVWTDSQTATPHLSSQVPLWYRNPEHFNPEDYPRVLVYDEYNRLIDDTHSQVTQTQAQLLRQHAQLNQQHYQRQQQQLAQQRQQASKLNASAKQGQVAIGMSIEQVKRAWGAPTTETVTQTETGSKTILSYADGRKVILIDEQVNSMTRPAPDKPLEEQQVGDNPSADKPQIEELLQRLPSKNGDSAASDNDYSTTRKQ